MVSVWFDGLNEKAQGFLIATLLFKSRESDSIIDNLDSEDASLIRERSKRILEMERAKRISILLTELRRLLMAPIQTSLSSADIGSIVKVLGNENRAMQIYALASLPKFLTRLVGEGLLFSAKEVQELPLLQTELAREIRKRIESQLQSLSQ